jgi:hypothetical protein
MAIKRSTRKKQETTEVDSELPETLETDSVENVSQTDNNSIGKVKEGQLTIFEMGVLFYLENFKLREMPQEKKANLMGNRIEAAERKLKALGYIKG